MIWGRSRWSRYMSQEQAEKLRDIDKAEERLRPRVSC
jgi:hypothetical protein